MRMTKLALCLLGVGMSFLGANFTLAAEPKVELNEHLKHHEWQLGTWRTPATDEQDGGTWTVSFTASLDGNALLIDGKFMGKEGNVEWSMHALRYYDPEQKALVTVSKGSGGGNRGRRRHLQARTDVVSPHKRERQWRPRDRDRQADRQQHLSPNLRGRGSTTTGPLH